MDLIRETAITQHVINSLAPVEPVITRVRSVIRNLMAETLPMELTALRSHEEFECGSGERILRACVCDHDNDHEDSSDEHSCREGISLG